MGLESVLILYAYLHKSGRHPRFIVNGYIANGETNFNMAFNHPDFGAYIFFFHHSIYIIGLYVRKLFPHHLLSVHHIDAALLGISHAATGKVKDFCHHILAFQFLDAGFSSLASHADANT